MEKGIVYDEGYEEYQLWALGYAEGHDSMLVPMEELLDTADTQEELDDLVRQVREATPESLKAQFKEEIEEYNIVSIQLQVEGVYMHYEEDEGVEFGEPVYEQCFDIK